METPELPLDVIQLICACLADDSSTLYHLSLTNRFYSTIALGALYSQLTKFPSDDDDDVRFVADATFYARRITKWSSLWKSLAMSALESHSTTVNYSRALRVLNLRDLLSLMEEFRPPRSQPVRAAFFAGGLEECNTTRSYNITGTPQTVFDFNTSMDALTDIITRGTSNVTTLIRQNTERPSTEPGHLHRWLRNLPALEILQVFSGDTFEDDRVRDAITNCPNLKSLEIFHWPAIVDPDVALSQLVSTISGKGLERLVVHSGNNCVRELALSALSTHHGSTLTELYVMDFSHTCLPALAMATNITNLRSFTVSLGNLNSSVALSEASCNAASQFLAQNPSLERLDMALYSADKILTPILPSLKLKHLSITDILETILPDSFWTAMNSQSSTLELLHLKTYNRYPELIRPSAKMINSIRLLYKLKSLTITAFTVALNDYEIAEIVESCPLLEDVYLASPSLTNLSLLVLASLQSLTNFGCFTSAQFTPEGVKDFIERRPTLSGLTIYIDERYIPFSQNVLMQCKTMMDKRGGTGFAVVEEELEPDYEETDMDDDYVPRWEL